MHSSSQPVLLLDESRLHNFDPTNQKDLFLMWSVFAKASEVMEHGKRLENMSWRLWNRQALCRDSARHQPRNYFHVPPSSSAPSPHRTAESTELPKLSSSVESACSMASTAADESEEHDGDPSSLPKRQPGSRALNFGSLVHSIKSQPLPSATTLPLQPAREQQQPRAATQTSSCTPRPSSPRNVAGESSTSTVATTSDSFISTAGTSHTSADSGSADSEHSVVRGFAPGRLSSYTSKSQLAPAPTPILKGSNSKAGPAKKKSGMFMLGGSSGDYESSLRDRMSPRSIPNISSPEKQSKKQTSFKDQIDEIKPATPEPNNDVFETDDEDEDEDEISESAIDEDDEDAWEDEAEEAPEKPKQISFQRIDSSANFQALPSRKSQIALDIERVRSTGNLQNIRSTPALRRSRTSTPNGPSMPASPNEESLLKMRAEPSRTSTQTLAKPISTTTNTQVGPNPALSPRTTRRNMLAGELTESFRKQMIWERQQRNVYTTQAPLKRAHTSADMRNLETARQPNAGESSSRGPWNQFFDGGSAEYHAKGW